MSEELRTFVENCIDLTFPLAEGISARGTYETELVEEYTADATRRFTHMLLHPHSVTHIDLPGTLDFKPIMEKVGPLPETYSAEMDFSYIQELTKVAVHDAIVIDFSDKFSFIEDFIDGHSLKDIDYRFFILKTDISAGDLENLLGNLLISQEEIAARTSYLDLENKIIIFYTGWNSKLRPSSNKGFDNSLFECWQPYLLHPYLDEKSIRYLCWERKIKGTASDTFGLECPLYFAQTKWSIPAVATLKQSVENDGALGTAKLPPYEPVHFHELGMKKWMIENIYLPGSKLKFPKVGGAIAGTLVTVPLISRDYTEATSLDVTLAKVLLSLME